MRHKLTILLLVVFIISCKNELTPKSKLKSEIEGTWKLLSAKKIIGKDTTNTKYADNFKGVKIINNNHFAFFQHDLEKGKDSVTAKFSSGGGKYILEGDNYTEFLEYCSSRKWEDNKFDFTVLVKNDSLIQTGIEKVPALGVDRIIVEIYVRVK